MSNEVDYAETAYWFSTPPGKGRVWTQSNFKAEQALDPVFSLVGRA